MSYTPSAERFDSSKFDLSANCFYDVALKLGSSFLFPKPISRWIPLDKDHPPFNMTSNTSLLVVALLIGSSSLIRAEVEHANPRHLTEEDFKIADTLDDEALWESLDEKFKTTGGPLNTVYNGTQYKSLWGIWKDNTVPYQIIGDFSSNDRAAIAKAIQYLERETCVRFRPTENSNSLPRMDIKAANLGGFCYAVWNTGGGVSATVNLSPNSACTMPRTILHEILHGFSWYHTHKRPDRDAHVKVLWDNVLGSKRDEFSICSGCCCKTWDTPYDCDSVMHYAQDQMSSNGKDTLAPVSGSCQLLPFSRWNHKTPYLSSEDMKFLRLRGARMVSGDSGGDFQFLTEENFARGRTLDVRALMAQIKEIQPFQEPVFNFTNGAEEKSVWAIWPNGEIPYTIQGEFSRTDLDAIAASFEYIEHNSCVKFVPTSNTNALPRMDIETYYEEFGICYTQWQTDGGTQTYARVQLSPSSACTVPRTIIHEIMHGFSMYHTHTRPDRDDHIRVMWDNISPGKEPQFEPCSGCCCDTWEEPYDCSSVMHYAANQMSSNGRDTLESVDENCQLLPFNEWNLHQPYMSASDVDLINQQYC
ncbi:hypothetical protein TCAL_07850 [Tigriopus californicus]|uniref:Metalloendopeptidase n=1 Tax=Tigriopus californicus TaxID=6832 RepID=A0A553PJD0_TIGCA|nr:hypothetical protein TCAL_07850 [Tigriopus californicus]